MVTLEDEFGDIDIAIEFQVNEPDTIAELKKVFENEDILESQAFSGLEILTILTTIKGLTFDRLIDFFMKMGTHTPKTSFKIGKNTIALTGYSRQDVEALLASSNFKEAVRAVQKS